MVVNWTDAEVFQLISSWAGEGIQEQLEGFKRNKHIYERLSRSLTKHNIEKQVNSVIQNYKSSPKNTKR